MLQFLPREILFYICEWLTFKALINLRVTSHFFIKNLNYSNDQIWKYPSLQIFKERKMITNWKGDCVLEHKDFRTNSGFRCKYEMINPGLKCLPQSNPFHFKNAKTKQPVRKLVRNYYWSVALWKTNTPRRRKNFEQLLLLLLTKEQIVSI